MDRKEKEKLERCAFRYRISQAKVLRNALEHYVQYRIACQDSVHRRRREMPQHVEGEGVSVVEEDGLKRELDVVGIDGLEFDIGEPSRG